ncbi:hypothetical protein AWN90_36935 [Nocardia terpenica]|uniref:Uncharacterized protein n=2 Tax=Nocardia terpenica TaxID=455432 RepID=A0A161Z1U5_9NOCA|nr:hypothetical protein AWN90_36935 [Nocardia terpenica]
MEELSNAYGALIDRGEETYKDEERFSDRMQELREQRDLAEAKLTVWLLGGGRRPKRMPVPEIVAKPNSARTGGQLLDPDAQWADIVRLEATVEALNAADADGDDSESIRSCEELGDRIRDLKANLLDQLAIGIQPPAAWSAPA